MRISSAFRTTVMKINYILVVAKTKNCWYPECMDTTRCVHYESNYPPDAANAAVSSPVYAFYYSYACQAMLEVRSSGE
jgi:hypothetical protein